MARRKPISAAELEALEKHLGRDDVAERVVRFAGGPLRDGARSGRERSYDHCYNYFADTHDLEADTEKSCAILGFYLASWGMYRGSTYLQQHTDSSIFIDTIRIIERTRGMLSEVDVHNYHVDDNVDLILEAYDAIRRSLLPDGKRHITLVTKIMVAVYGCVPAFDEYFFRGFRKVLGGRVSVSYDRITADSLKVCFNLGRAPG